MRAPRNSILPLIALLGLLAQACGNVGVDSERYSLHESPSGSRGTVSSSPGSATSSDQAQGYSCPSSPNVLPDYDAWLDGTAHYTVCANSQSRNKILIHGQTANAGSVCVFPAQYTSAARVDIKPRTDGQPGPLYHTIEIGPSGVFDEYEAALTFNAVFIVEEPNCAQMATCLATTNAFGCPAYSFGRFR